MTWLIVVLAAAGLGAGGWAAVKLSCVTTTCVDCDDDCVPLDGKPL